MPWRLLEVKNAKRNLFRQKDGFKAEISKKPTRKKPSRKKRKKKNQIPKKGMLKKPNSLVRGIKELNPINHRMNAKEGEVGVVRKVEIRIRQGASRILQEAGDLLFLLHPREMVLFHNPKGRGFLKRVVCAKLLP